MIRKQAKKMHLCKKSAVVLTKKDDKNVNPWKGMVRLVIYYLTICRAQEIGIWT